jgi:hypothetical protein
MSGVPADLAFLHWLTEMGFLHPRPIPGGRWAAVQPKLYTHSISIGRIGDESGIDDCWCYPTRAEAEAALEAWDGTGEPEGWMRNPTRGRRRALTEGEYDEDDRPVPLGAIYRRW